MIPTPGKSPTPFACFSNRGRHNRPRLWLKVEVTTECLVYFQNRVNWSDVTSTFARRETFRRFASSNDAPNISN